MRIPLFSQDYISHSLFFFPIFFTENAAQYLNLSGSYRLYIFGIRQQGRGSRQQQL